VTFLRQSFFLAIRDIRALLRQPWFVALTVFQPILSLTLYGQVFQKVADLPGAGQLSYIAYIAPGMIILTGLFSGSWHGMAILRELERGTFDRFLICPVARSAIFTGRIVALNSVIVIQALLLIIVARLMGAHFAGWSAGICILLFNTVLLSSSSSLVSNGVALLIRREESLLCLSNFAVLPLAFLSSVFMSENLMPHWIGALCRFNPVNWGVASARQTLSAHGSATSLWTSVSGLIIVLLVSAGFMSCAFAIYRRSA